MKRGLLIAAAVFAGACGNDELQRMVTQPKYLPYKSNDFYEDGRAMRTPPAGTVSREGAPGSPALEPRLANGEYLDRIPVPITSATLKEGRKTFNIICAACHGLVGDGQSVVGRKMSLKAPPSLHDYADKPDGFFFEVTSKGYGVMPGYASEIPSAEQRWAVVAYVRALLISQKAPLEAAPPGVQAQLLKEQR